MTSTSSGEDKQLSPLSTFPRFSDLVIELRIQIWQHALHSATANRVIPVVINHHPAVIMHSCLPLLGSFCGQHSHCPSHNSDSSQSSSSLVCMFSGYFSLPANTDIENYALGSLSLACTESRNVVLFQYPEAITIYKEKWFPDVESHQRRQVRCNPATDTLLIKAVPNYSSEQRHPSLSLNNPGDLYHQDLKKWFPQNVDMFTSFRYIISTFRHVEFSFPSNLQSLRLLSSEAFDSTEFKQFLIFFERLEHICLRTGPENFTEWERVEDIEDRRDSSVDNMDLQNFVGVSSGILNCDHGYNDYVWVQSELSTDSGGCCWVPMPKGFGGSWLFCSRGI